MEGVCFQSDYAKHVDGASLALTGMHYAALSMYIRRSSAPQVITFNASLPF